MAKGLKAGAFGGRGRSPVDALRARVQFVQRQQENLRPAVGAVHTRWIKDRARDFKTGGATTQHGPWQSNKASTIKRKGHGRVLFGIPAAGYKLHKSIVNRRDKDHVFEWVKGVSIEMGTKHWKARIHHLGLNPKAPIIRRPIDPTDKQKRRYARILSNWVFKGKLP